MSSDPRIYRLRRALFVRRLRWQAKRAGAGLDLDIALDARIGRRVRVELEPDTDNLLYVGTASRLRDDVSLRLSGGQVRIGDWCDVRDGTIINVGGELTLDAGCILSWRTVIHCNGRTHLAELVGASDHVSIVDSTHYHTESDVPFHDNLKTGTIEIGRNSWLGSKATVLRNTRIGERCIVGAGAVVSGEVPDDHVALGNPAALQPRRGGAADRESSA